MATDFDDLSEDLQDVIVKRETEVEDLKFESNIYRVGMLFVFALVAHQLWGWFF